MRRIQKKKVTRDFLALLESEREIQRRCKGGNYWLLVTFESLFISAFVDTTIGIRKFLCQLLILMGSAQFTKSFCRIEHSLRTLNSEFNCELNSTPDSDPTPTSPPTIYWPLRTAYINWGRGLDNVWLRPWIMICKLPGPPIFRIIFLKKFQMAILTGTKNEFGTPAVYCPDKYY